MKRCKCIRFRDMQYLRRESRLWIFSDEYGLMPVESEYPLIEFDEGNPITICPYYLFLTSDMRIANAYFNYGKLTTLEKEIIDEKVLKCEHRVPADDMKYIEDRHASVLGIYAEHISKAVDEEMFDDFYDFIQVRQGYLDISPCLVIPPRDHSDRMECINQAWIEAFKEYLKENK